MDKIEIKDLLGIEPYGEIGLEVTKASIKGISSFLNVVFKPGLQELGFMFSDNVHARPQHCGRKIVIKKDFWQHRWNESLQFDTACQNDESDYTEHHHTLAILYL